MGQGPGKGSSWCWSGRGLWSRCCTHRWRALSRSCGRRRTQAVGRLRRHADEEEGEGELMLTPRAGRWMQCAVTRCTRCCWP